MFFPNPKRKYLPKDKIIESVDSSNLRENPLEKMFWFQPHIVPLMHQYAVGGEVELHNSKNRNNINNIRNFDFSNYYNI